MKALLKEISLANEPIDFETYKPDDEQNFSIDLMLKIGSDDGDDGVDNFDLNVCTPEWLCDKKWLPELLRNTLLVRNYDKNIIIGILNDYISKCYGDTWEDVALKLSRVFFWEYEDCDK